MTEKTQRAKARTQQKKPRLGEEHIRPDGSVIRYVREEGDDDKPVEHYRTVDTLALMLRNGSITGAMHDARGILIAGLEVLARYYGYDRSGSGRSRRPPQAEAVP